MDRADMMTTHMSIDLKKFRIRVHKESLRLIGNPRYIQLLVNVETQQVAIRSVQKETAGDQAHRVDPARIRSDNSVEIYSRMFIDTLQTEFACFQDDGLYRLKGVVLPEKRAVVFPLSTLQSCSPEVVCDGR